MKGEREVEHRTRRVLLNYIEEHPGSSFGAISKTMDINEGTLRYHLNYLEDREIISSQKDGRKRRYYSSLVNGPANMKDLESLGSKQRRILDIIRTEPGITHKELYSMMDISRRKLSGVISSLMDRKLVWKVENGNGVGYEFITKERLVQEMRLTMIEKLINDEVDQTTFLRIMDHLDEREENS